MHATPAIEYLTGAACCDDETAGDVPAGPVRPIGRVLQRRASLLPERVHTAQPVEHIAAHDAARAWVDDDGTCDVPPLPVALTGHPRGAAEGMHAAPAVQRVPAVAAAVARVGPDPTPRL